MSFEQKFFRTLQHEVEDEEQAAQRWRRVLLKLSDNFNAVSAERADLSPVLMEALHHALENLLVVGDEADLMALEEWADIEQAQNPDMQTSATSQRDESGIDVERRRDVERRFTERRIASHFQMELNSPDGDSANGANSDRLRERRSNPDRRKRSERRNSPNSD